MTEESRHAVLTPSSAERWIACPASVRMSRQVPHPPTSFYAGEGTAAHALAELEARAALLTPLNKREYTAKIKAWRAEYSAVILDEEEMKLHAAAYVELLRNALSTMPNSKLLLEQRVPTGVPSCWGTSDAVIVSPFHIEIIDLKYGKGLRVEAVGNPQLRLYGVGALEAFGDVLGEVKTVVMTVFQPRLGHVVSEELAAVDLREWRNSLIPIAERALGHDAEFGPSDAACRWCPASGQCKAQLEYATTLDFSVDPDVLGSAELADVLDRLPQIEEWCTAVRKYALDLVYNQGGMVPRYKVVLSGGKRFIADPEGALAALQAIGYTFEEVASQKIKGIGELETLLKKDFPVMLSSFLGRTAGSPSLVSEDDKRASTNPSDEAQRDFSAPLHTDEESS